MDRDQMLSRDKIQAKLQPSDNNKTSAAARKRQATNVVQSDQALIRCPRCDSPNTKFCYYNNYSLTQPRYFCKACRRYWTKGGVLRNVPVGGGCRKSKKTKSSAAAAATAPLSEMGHLKFLNGLSSGTELSQFNIGLPFTRLHSPTDGANANNITQLFSLGGLSSIASTSPCSAFDTLPISTSSLEGFNYYTSASTALKLGEGGVFRGVSTQENIASSIESLSSINQDLHWKLQQQRLAMLSSAPDPLVENQQQPNRFPPVESSTTEASCVDHRDINVLLLENSYSVVADHENMTNINMSTSWNEMQTWSELNQYNIGLP